jgi:hypothetical protein
LTAGERRLVDRELEHATGRRLLSLAQRLDRSPASILDLADPEAGVPAAAGGRRGASTG